MAEKKNSKGISSYIKVQLESIEEGKALSVAALVQELLQVFPFIKDRTSASARINLVLNQKKIRDRFMKIRGKDKRVYVVNVIWNAHLSQEMRKEKEDGGTKTLQEEITPELERREEVVAS